MESENEIDIGGRRLALFSERVVAFSIDAALAVGGYALSHLAIFPGSDLIGSPHAAEWSALWTFLFILYEAYFSAEGRASLGKLLLGLRVVDAHGEPLSIGQASIRSVTYLASSILDLGFLWSWLNPNRQCWHDLVVNSVVVAEEPRSAPSLALVRAAAVGCLSLIAGLWYWNNVAEVRYHRIMNVAYAQVGMSELNTLQRIYHLKHHRYADNMNALAPLSAEPKTFLRNMDNLFDARKGVQIEAGKDKYTIKAHAMDDNSTLVALNGP